MKANIHPTYYPEAEVVCASCGSTWKTGSTKKSLHVEVCSNCHPFFSGQQARIMDIEGQVDRFYKKLQARQSYVEEKEARDQAKAAPKRPIGELELGPRATKALEAAGITDATQLLAKLAEGDNAVLAIDGFGRKSLIDAKKKLRGLGYTLPGEAEAQAV
jgi:large subunit ribosomal protein L31